MPQQGPRHLVCARLKSPLHILTHLILRKPYEERAIIPHFVDDKHQGRKRLSPLLS